MRLLYKGNRLLILAFIRNRMTRSFKLFTLSISYKLNISSYILRTSSGAWCFCVACRLLVRLIRDSFILYYFIYFANNMKLLVILFFLIKLYARKNILVFIIAMFLLVILIRSTVLQVLVLIRIWTMKSNMACWVAPWNCWI